MYRIAIVDDDYMVRESTKAVIERNFKEENFQVECFSTFSQLQSELSQELFTVYILDIELPDGNGLELAKEIRKIQERAYIVFLTAYEKYALFGYEVRAFHYIIKENMEKKLVVCPYCASGCKISFTVENNKIIKAEGANGVTNQGELCLKGYYGWDFINDTQILTPRLKTPMIRRQRGGKLESVSWDEALNYVADRLSAIKAKYGPDAIQTTGSSRGTGNETNYVMQKFARAVIGTNNVDCCARV